MRCSWGRTRSRRSGWRPQPAGIASRPPCAAKLRRGDRDVAIDIPSVRLAGRAVVLVDDMASTGTTLAVAARRCLELGARTVDVLVVHGLFVGDAIADLRRAGVRHVWSTDSVLHPTNVLPLAPLLADAMRVESGIGEQEPR